MARESYFCRPAWVPAGLALLLLLALAGCREGMGSVSQTPVVTIAPVAGSVAAGSPLQFVVRAAPAPRADLAVGVTITPSGCDLIDPPTSVTIAAGKTEATLTVSTNSAGMGEAGCEVTAAIAEGEGYRTGNAGAASASATVTPERQTPGPQVPGPPVVTVVANASTVTGGSEVSFTLTATPAPASDLTVTVRWSEQGSFLPASAPETVTIPTTGTVELQKTIPGDRVDEQDGSVTVTVEAGSGYTVGTHGTASVAITNGATPPAAPPGPSGPFVRIHGGIGGVTEGTAIGFGVSARWKPDLPLTVNVSCSQRGYNARAVDVLDGRPPTTVEITTLVTPEPKYGDPYGVGALYVATKDDNVPEVIGVDPSRGYTAIAGLVTCTIRPGTNYQVVGRRASATRIVLDNDYSEVSVAANAATVQHGQPVSFTLTADPAPNSDLPVILVWNGAGLLSTVTIPARSSTATFSIAPGDKRYRDYVYVVVRDTTSYLLAFGKSSAKVTVIEAED